MKYSINIKWYACLLLLCGGGVIFGLETAKEFDVKYKIIKGKDICKSVGLPGDGDGDYHYIVGTIKNLTPHNMMVSISLHHRQNKAFNTAGYQKIGWIDGNHSAARIFIFPMGLRNQELPKPADNIDCDIKILMKK